MQNTNRPIIVMVALLAGAAAAEAPRDELKQLVEQLQKTPGDKALRERTVKLAAELKPAPAVPPEARRSFVMAGTFQKEAKTPSDFALAIAAYQDALKVAPWWGDAWYNLSVSLESAGRLDEARGALELYLLTKPRDAEEAQNRLFALEAKTILAAKQATETERAAAEAARKKATTLIVPGVGIGEVKLSMNEAQAVASWGAPSKRDTFNNDNGYFGVTMKWGGEADYNYLQFTGNKGMSFVTTQRRSFVTSDGLSVGSSMSAVTAAMGSPGRTIDYGGQNGICICYAQGITFTSAQPSRVTLISVMKPDDALGYCGN